MEQSDVQWETIYSPPFTGPMPEGEDGQWFSVPGEGYYWTDTLGVVGFLSLNNNSDAPRTLNALKYAGAKSGKDAHDVFNDVWESVQDQGFPIELVDGSLDDLRAEYNHFSDYPGLVAAAGLPSPVEPEEYGITLDDEGHVLELVKTGPDGVFIREGADWVALDTSGDEDENDTVFGREWLDVSPEAVVVYDSGVDADSMLRDDFTPFILN